MTHGLMYTWGWWVVKVCVGLAVVGIIGYIGFLWSFKIK